MIIETIVTSVAADGGINFAPMGVEWDEDALVLKPFLETTTFRNVSSSRTAVVNLTDDVMLFAQAAISSPQFPHVPAEVVRGVVLEAACYWREVEVVRVDDTPPRSRIDTRVVHRGRRREFLGFNRARHAVLEAAILATRTHLIPAEQIRDELAKLQVIVDKTAGPREREAMALLTEYVRAPIASSWRPGARLHFGVLDLRGALGRRFGGLGAAIPEPSLLLEAAPAGREVTAEGPDSARAGEFARRFLEFHGLERGVAPGGPPPDSRPQRPGLRHPARAWRSRGRWRSCTICHRIRRRWRGRSRGAIARRSGPGRSPWEASSWRGAGGPAGTAWPR